MPIDSNIGPGIQQTPYDISTTPPTVENVKPAALPEVTQAPGDSITTSDKTVVPPAGYDTPAHTPKLSNDPKTEEQEGVTTDPKDVGNTSKIYDPPTNVLQAAHNAFVTADGLAQIQKELVAKMPEGPEKDKYLDFLAKVSSALIDLQAALQEMAAGDSKGAKDRSRAKLETALNKLEEQKRQTDEIKQKQGQTAEKQRQMAESSKALGILGVVVQCIMFVILTPILLATTGPFALIALSFMMINIISSCEKLDNPNAKTVMDKVMDGVAQAATGIMELVNKISVDTTGKPLPADVMKKAEVAVKAILVIAIVATMIASAPIAAVFAPDAIMGIISSSHIVTDIAVATAATPEQAAMAEMAAQIVMGCIAMIVGIAASIVMPGAFAGVIGKMASMAEKIGKIAIKGAQLAAGALAKTFELSDKAAKTLTNVMKGVFKVLSNPDLYISVSTIALQSVNTAATSKFHSLMAEISLMRGKMDANIEVQDAVIEVLKKMIAKLLESMQGIMQDSAAVGSLLQSQKEGLSEVLTNLQG